MKSKLFLASVLLLSGCATTNPFQPQVQKACIGLDGALGFGRCETPEVVCYVSNGALQCWPKNVPQPVAPKAPEAAKPAEPVKAPEAPKPAQKKA